MEIDLEKLKRLAHAADGNGLWRGMYDSSPFDDDAFISAANPATVLDLIAAIEQLQGENRQARRLLGLHDPASVGSLAELYCGSALAEARLQAEGWEETYVSHLRPSAN